MAALIDLYKFEVENGYGVYLAVFEKIIDSQESCYVLTSGVFTPQVVTETSRKFYSEREDLYNALAVAQFKVELEYCL